MAVLDESPPKVREPAQPAANRKDVSPQPRPSRGARSLPFPRIRVRFL